MENQFYGLIQVKKNCVASNYFLEAYKVLTWHSNNVTPLLGATYDFILKSYGTPIIEGERIKSALNEAKKFQVVSLDYLEVKRSGQGFIFDKPNKAFVMLESDRLEPSLEEYLECGVESAALTHGPYDAVLEVRFTDLFELDLIINRIGDISSTKRTTTLINSALIV